MLKNSGVAGAASALMAGAVALAPTAAVASPPSGLLTWTDTARVPAVGTAKVKPVMGHGATYAAYTFEAGSSTGWRTLTGPAVLAVTGGALRITAAKGCTTTDYPAGGAAVLPAGTYLVTAERGATVGGLVTDVAKGVADPLTASRIPAVKGCAAPAGSTSLLKASGVTASGAALGVFTKGGVEYLRSDGPHGDGHADHFTVKDGQDVGITLYRFLPGFSTGWHSHYGPFVAIVTKGEIVYYEGNGSGCVESGRYKAGDAYFADIQTQVSHNHIAETTTETEVVGVYVNMPRTAAAVPVVGQQLDSVDFTKLPGAGCPRLR